MAGQLPVDASHGAEARARPGACQIGTGRHRGAMLSRVATEADVRRIALSLPATTEKPSYGMPGFRVRDRLFARVREDDAVVVFCADLAEKEALLASEPDVLFTTPHYDGSPTVLVRLHAIDEEELTELLTEAWRVRAPTRLRAAFDADAPR